MALSSVQITFVEHSGALMAAVAKFADGKSFKQTVSWDGGTVIDYDEEGLPLQVEFIGVPQNLRWLYQLMKSRP